MRKALVMGAGGFAGGELMRILCGHPHLELAAALSETHAGRRIGDVHPTLDSATDLVFLSRDEWDWDRVRAERWVMFSALAHTQTMKVLPPILDGLGRSGLKVVDLSGDFRLDGPEAFESYYGEPHVEPGYLERFVYGLPELMGEAIRGADHVANPGCFATGAQLAIAPAAAAGARVVCIAIDGKTGSSGAGARPGRATHHPNRMNNFSAYGQLTHRQVPEIEAGWRRAGGNGACISFVPHRAPMVRGIFTTAHLFLEEPLPAGDVFEWYASFYRGSPFVRIVDGSASVARVWGTNRCDVSICVDGVRVIVCTAIDNLVKGAAGQAVQNANLMNGWDETAGLLTPVPSPV